ncbi:LysE family transporter [Caldithrix abyssi]|nr:LysE family transporter [Caldithrix abyssi]
MENEISAILLVVALFLLGVISPGPNFLVVVQKSLSSGQRGGIITGLGVATGDALYSSAGLFGLSALITQSGWLFFVIKLAGGLYISWMGLKMIWKNPKSVKQSTAATSDSKNYGKCFRLGLITDLSNPKTVVFFASIFATTYNPAHPMWVSFAMLSGIIMTSIVWRIGLATVFSRNRIRDFYLHFRRSIERFFGSILLLLGLRLAFSDQTNSP